LLRVAFRAWEDALYATTAAEILRRSGDTVRELDPGDAQALFPPLGEVRAALHSPRAARIDGRRITASLRHGAEARGATMQAGSVERLVVHRGRVEAVETDSGRLVCGSVVIAGGAWTPALGDQLGVQLPIMPVRGQIVHLRAATPPATEWPIVQPVLSYYVVPWPEGRFAVGGTVEPDAGFDATPTAEGMRQLLSELLALAPGLRDATFLEVRVGLRPVSVDDTPILGRVPGSDNAFVVTGHGANGLLLGPFSARLVTQLIAGEAPRLDLSPFGAERFSDPNSLTARAPSA
jgi:D-amino-acid dehydrogenase